MALDVDEDFDILILSAWDGDGQRIYEMQEMWVARSEMIALRVRSARTRDDISRAVFSKAPPKTFALKYAAHT